MKLLEEALTAEEQQSFQYRSAMNLTTIIFPDISFGQIMFAVAALMNISEIDCAWSLDCTVIEGFD